MTCTAGEVEVDVEYVPRPEYGLVVPLLDVVDGGLAATGGADVLVLSCPVPVTVDGVVGVGPAAPRDGRARRLRAAPPQAGRRRDGPDVERRPRSRARLDDTVAAWQSWSELHQAYDGPWRDLVHHSGRVLQALSFQPTGAICAAATTSLPEVVGGTRNWDYRYAWVRDASFTIEALWVAACPDEANEFFDYMTAFGGRVARATRRPADHVRHRRRARPDRAGAAPPRRAGGTPRRCGSATARGASASSTSTASCSARCTGSPTGSSTRRPSVGPAADPTGGTRRPRWRRPPGSSSSTSPTPPPRRWQEQDHGIWEVRGEPRHFVYSKLMCWVALDRAIDARRPARRRRPGRRVGARRRREIRERDPARRLERPGRRVHPVVRLRRPRRVEPDAAARRVPPRRRPAGAGDDRRHRGAAHRRARAGLPLPRRTTVSTARRAPSCSARSGWRRRWRWPAGPTGRAPCSNGPPPSSTTSACSRRRSTRSTGELLGNFPQAFSHIGLVNAAWAISAGRGGHGLRRRSQSGSVRSHPWNGDRSPASHASRSPGAREVPVGPDLAESPRAGRATGRRSTGRPQNQ